MLLFSNVAFNTLLPPSPLGIGFLPASSFKAYHWDRAEGLPRRLHPRKLPASREVVGFGQVVEACRRALAEESIRQPARTLLVELLRRLGVGSASPA